MAANGRKSKSKKKAPEARCRDDSIEGGRAHQLLGLPTHRQPGRARTAIRTAAPNAWAFILSGTVDGAPSRIASPLEDSRTG